ncbi:MAG TPA: iron-sulfur cluster co-chaperone HscB C-terminal domain-containing protein [Chitinophagaceae bacterium]|nr:iron-sulfur cluster co-chaperone HscB C-terminal domain-containing protein [Chitinophagaceae bacterium]
MNYFELFELPMNLNIDEQAIQKKYYALCRRFHPDQFMIQDEAKQQHAEQMTTLIHEARRILLNPSQRLLYFLQEQGINTDQNRFKPDPAFLSEMMDWNEQVDDCMGNEDEKKRIREGLLQLADSLREPVQQYFDRTEPEMQENELMQLLQYYYQQQYIERLLNRL